ncbi:adenosylmethionine-8-amino-7-oxononanoate aminotransferase [Marinobacterium zhoushanense]|uniref:Adenosylmethionine-8-amino-7-oxononanoate aminotransferase n=1 Tax=Marinobacterium zhoushanense TaxID=1679163 RepID=A0ABQ1K9U3_9GAMM|nr:adenosylmethionine--8-amino-7-oxononanoate transaminase [Marinobacterium zhoushanense]GGB88374.1 adenosylmethionine-8-amino-7-oxononanoate aminotransferase [Marinobacterium zhoushanense]
MPLTSEQLAFDQQHIWHPYSSMINPPPMVPVESASGVRIRLSDGRELIDGMASWWSVIHGYNHPSLNAAAHAQIDRVAHVMFGGLTHEPAIELSRKLVQMTPAGLDRVFLADSGSVAVEVAMKMAIQYWHARGKPGKHKLVALQNGYHGDTFGAMSVCDPVTGMHELFSGVLAQQVHIPRPATRFGQPLIDGDCDALEQTLREHGDEIAALIVEPIVQGAGGMYFYSPEWLKQARILCDRYEVLLIADEIATGFGRSGKLFACEHAGISPDILCLGKALTGGYMTLSATLTTAHIGETISAGGAGCFMHGPTFMGNPLACAVANASLTLLQEQDWQAEVSRIETRLTASLSPAASLSGVADVRVLGAIGVIELHEAVSLASVQPLFVEQGIWVRPFGKLVYVMPPYVMSNADLDTLCSGIIQVLNALEG